MAQCSIASTSAPRNTVSPTINRMGLIPTDASSLSCVFMPSALMAITRHQRDRLFPASCTACGMKPVLLAAARTTKPTANHGSSGGRLLPGSAPRTRVIMAAQRITGSSIATRISFTTVALSPVSWDML
ncbi:hypothetical protein D9M69_605590 [compost metagenome]